jgi:putative DNA primase/helicase
MTTPDFMQDYRQKAAALFPILAHQHRGGPLERATNGPEAPAKVAPHRAEERLPVGAGEPPRDQPVASAEVLSGVDSDGWPEPQPLAAKVKPEPYPLDALPDTIRAAVIEVQAFTKAPIPMVAGAALAALSLAIQSYADIKRADKLHGPVGLFLLTIADSGERKSTCDGFFTSAIRDYQAEQAELAKPKQEKCRAELSAWEAKRTGMLDAIKQASRSSKPTANIERELHQHEQDKPEPPRVPKLLRGDDTPENLAYVLAREWPSAGAISAEGGIIFGSHGMGSESAMRNLALLNILWDGGTHDIGRRSKESFTVQGARLTVALQVQEPTLREFFAKSGALARGTGFLARFLVAWPESTQGFRPFTEAPANWPHLAEFNRRIAALLNQPAPIDDSGALTPAMMTLAPEAKRAWVAFHDAIERELASGGELYDVRDVASKSADNAARLSALFQVFEHGTGGAVGLDCFEGASRIAAWHLHESRRFFGELALPAELADAARLDTWLIEYCRRKSTLSVGKNHVRQHGPLRDGARLDAAIRELAELDRLRLEKDGKRLMNHVNPALVEVAP